MRFLAVLVALFIIAVGVAGIFTPHTLMTVARYVLTPVGLYAVGALRVGIGLVLTLVAPISRAPRTLRALGVVVIIAGLATPLFGVDRARALLEWQAARGPSLIRVGGGLALVIGGLITFAVADRRRERSG